MRQISTNGIDPGIDTPNSRTREKRKANACSCIVTSQGGKPIAQEQHPAPQLAGLRSNQLIIF
jgi:hypothetical protein